MATYKDRALISAGMRAILAAAGLFALALCGLWIAVGFRQTWFPLLVSVCVAYYCLARSIRGYHVVTRDDGEP